MSRAETSAPSSNSLSISGNYLDQSKLPLVSLVFLLPLIVLYQLGTHPGSGDVRAFSLILQFFGLIGISGRTLPALVVVAMLVTWHISREDPWRFSPVTLGGMLLESLGLAAPLIVMDLFTRQHLPMFSGPDQHRLVMSMGAGVYEEFVFRLVAATLLGFALNELAKCPKVLATVVIVLLPAVLFSLYHYLGPERFTWRTFAFRTAAGVYFGVAFLLRGFGVTAGSHAAYDIIAALLAAGAHA